MPQSTTRTRTEVCGSGGITRQEKLEELQERQARLQEEKRECCADEDSRISARSVNLDAELIQIEGQIRAIEEESAEDSEPGQIDPGTIQTGSVVTVLTNKGSECQFTIVAKGSKGKNIITICSPWGEALSGKRAGDEATASTPSGPVTWKVLAVS